MNYLEARRGIPRRTVTYYLIGDEAASKSYFFEAMGVAE